MSVGCVKFTLLVSFPCAAAGYIRKDGIFSWKSARVSYVNSDGGREGVS